MSTRISTNQLYQSSQNHVSAAREREVISSEKASTNKEINRPSDNPTGWVHAANLKDDLSMKDTIAKNASLSSRSLTMSETALGQIQEFVQRAHEITITAASDSIGTAESRNAIKAEVQSLFDHTIRALNTRFGGRSLFSGTQTLGAAFDKDGKYLGDNGQFKVEIGKGLFVPINVDARQIINGEGLEGGVSIIDTFKGLIYGLEQNNSYQIRESLPHFLKAVEQLSFGRSQIGARLGEIDRAVNSHAAERIDSLDSISKVEEVDIVKAYSDLTRDQTVLRAAISTTQKILGDDPTQILYK